MARRALAGEAVKDLARELNDRAIPTVNGSQWSRQGLRLVLVSGRISGRREYKPTDSYEPGHRPLVGQLTATDAWPAIISPADSDRLRALLADPNRAFPPRRSYRYLLSDALALAQFAALDGDMWQRWEHPQMTTCARRALIQACVTGIRVNPAAPAAAGTPTASSPTGSPNTHRLEPPGPRGAGPPAHPRVRAGHGAALTHAAPLEPADLNPPIRDADRPFRRSADAQSYVE
jgi:Recombinase